MFKNNPSFVGIITLLLVSVLVITIQAFSYHIEMRHSHDKISTAKIVKHEMLSTNISSA